jgi:predicted transcriptional regulator with HTH domain
VALAQWWLWHPSDAFFAAPTACIYTHIHMQPHRSISQQQRSIKENPSKCIRGGLWWLCYMYKQEEAVVNNHLWITSSVGCNCHYKAKEEEDT